MGTDATQGTQYSLIFTDEALRPQEEKQDFCFHTDVEESPESSIVTCNHCEYKFNNENAWRAFLKKHEVPDDITSFKYTPKPKPEGARLTMLYYDEADQPDNPFEEEGPDPEQEAFNNDLNQARRILKKMDAYNIARKENPPAFDFPAHEAVKLMLMEDLLQNIKTLTGEQNGF